MTSTPNGDLEKLLGAWPSRLPRSAREFENDRYRADATVDGLRATLGGSTPEQPTDVEGVIEALVQRRDARTRRQSRPAATSGSSSAAATPAALAADWLTSGVGPERGPVRAPHRPRRWSRKSPARWLVELFGLPAATSVGFVTGGQMANFTGLAAARHEVLRRTGWDVESQRPASVHRRSGSSSAPSGTTTIDRRAALPRVRDRLHRAGRCRRPGPRCGRTRWRAALAETRRTARSFAPRPAT